jgi:hypothetical protein
MDQRTNEQLDYALAAVDELADRPPELQLEALGTTLLGEFAQAELDRRLTEERWLKDLRQYKGQYDPDVAALIGPNRSKAFLRKTRVKVKTVDSRVADLLFPAGTDRNWDVGPTPKPSIAPELKAQIEQRLLQQAEAERQAMVAQMQAAGQPADLPQVRRIPEPVLEQAISKMVAESSKRMAKVIDDQLTEARYKEVSLKALHSGHLYGTGIVKGPLVERRVRTRFVKEGGRWLPKSESYVVPFVDFVPVWRWFPDMSATRLDQCRYVYERHHMTRSDLAELASRKSFRGEAIKNYIKAHPDGEIRLRYYDNELRVIGERTSTQGNKGGQYEVLERWGYLTGTQLRNAGVEVEEDRVHESFFSNVWLLPNGTVIKAALQPIDGVTWPYHVYYFDKDETSIFGEGLATVMRDDQTMINAAIRMLIDNAAVTSGPQMEVAVALLSSMERIDEIAPWKVWPRNASSPGSPAIRPIELPSRMPELSSMVQMFEANADEVTAIPRYMYGENATAGAAGTSSGLSMLMGAVNIVIKDLITAWDDVTVSFIKSLYHWNMKFHPDDSIKGDYDVEARGTASLMAKEVRARALNEFAMTTANELDGPFVKRHKLLLARAEVNELGDVVKTEDEVEQEQANGAAQQMAQMQQQIQQLQLQEAQAKIAKITAEAEAIKGKANETLANIELIVAKAVATKVEAAYAALQAGGVATQSPHIAPAGDEILRSSGWRDATPDPSIAKLAGPPVQTGQIGAPASPEAAGAPDTPDPSRAGPPDLEPQTGMAGRREGIETPDVGGTI